MAATDGVYTRAALSVGCVNVTVVVFIEDQMTE